MAKLYFRENVDFLPECSEMYAKLESWIPAESPHSEKLRRKQLRVVPSFSQNFTSLAKLKSQEKASSSIDMFL